MRECYFLLLFIYFSFFLLKQKVLPFLPTYALHEHNCIYINFYTTTVKYLVSHSEDIINTISRVLREQGAVYLRYLACVLAHTENNAI